MTLQSFVVLHAQYIFIVAIDGPEINQKSCRPEIVSYDISLKLPWEAEWFIYCREIDERVKEPGITHACTDTRLIIVNLFLYCLEVLFHSISHFFCVVKCSMCLKLVEKAGCTTKQIVFPACSVQGFIELSHEQTKIPWRIFVGESG